jgi:hypothetical protein
MLSAECCSITCVTSTYSFFLPHTLRLLKLKTSQATRFNQGGLSLFDN